MGLDHDLLRFLNRDLANPVFDGVLALVSLLGYLWPLALVGLVLWVRGRKWEAVAVWTALLVAAGVSESLKLAIQRPRPEDVRLLIGRGDGFAMPSGHALRAAALAVVLWPLGLRARVAGVSFALLTALSRVYVGAHYPSDVAAGLALGVPVGLGTLAFMRSVRLESSLPARERLPFFQFVLALFRTFDNMDRIFRLKLVGAADASARWAVYWGLLRFFGPLVPVALFFVVYPIFWGDIYANTLACMGGYFFPFGVEAAVPFCVAYLGIEWWRVLLVVFYIDLFLSLFMILNLDYLYAMPWLGPRLARAQARGLAFMQKRPWMMRFQFVGVVTFVFVPIAGTGIIPAVLIGRFIGMPRLHVWAAVMGGTVLRILALGLGTDRIASLF